MVTHNFSMAASSDSDPENLLEEGNFSVTAECKQSIFVKLVKQHQVLLMKSQLPKIKAEKECALKQMAVEYLLATGTSLTDKQLMKKLNNMVKVKSDVSKTGNKPIKLKEWEKLLLDMMQTQNSSVISGLKGNKNTFVNFYIACPVVCLNVLKINLIVDLKDVILILSGAVSVGVHRAPTADLPAPSTPSTFKIKPLQISQPQGRRTCTESNTSEEIPARPVKKRKATTLPETEEIEGLSTAELQRLR